MCQSLFINKVSGLRPATLSKKETLAQNESEFCEISKNTSWWLLLKILTQEKTAMDSLCYNHCKLTSKSGNLRFIYLFNPLFTVDFFLVIYN